MASNNYAEVITDSTEAQRVKAELESMAAQGCSFLVREFNPKVDRFEVACWRESNYPTLLDVEAGGTPMDAAAVTALWKANADTLQSINYGNGPSVCSMSRRVAATLPSRTPNNGWLLQEIGRSLQLPSRTTNIGWFTAGVRREHDKSQ